MVDGILLVDKGPGWTSHDVVAKLRRLARQRRIGHTGTLDPAATGLLVVCLGRATRLVEYLTASRKTYEGIIQLGTRTNTDDLEGEVVEERPVPPIDARMLTTVAAQFTGELAQIPPAFSAISIGGERAYKRARAGEVVELPPRPVTIHDIVLTSLDANRLRVHVTCGAGTYIRSLARDIGVALGTVGTLAWLRRTSSGSFHVEDAATMEDLAALAEAGTLDEHILPPDEGLLGMQAAILGSEHTGRLLHGNPVQVNASGSCGDVRLFDSRGHFLGIGALDGDGELKARKIFPQDGG